MSDFPFRNPTYVKHVLEPHFAQARALFLQPMLAITRAHTLMLHQTNLLELRHAKNILAALETIQHEDFSYSEQFEDLFFALEARLLALAGVEAAGNLQLARSRNDLDAALIRVILRDKTLHILATLEQFCQVVLNQAQLHTHSLMPGYTHHQPAQPTTLGHYLSGMLGVLGRDTKRLQAAYSSINLSPLGAVAMTGTGFPIDRTVLEQYLGFDAVLENGMDAVGAVDHSLELVSAIHILSTNLSRMVHDLVFWASQELGFFRVANEFIQISSIMPQKRNPVVLEHTRAKLARASGYANTAFGMVGNIPFGDVNDVAEPLLPVTLAALSETQAALELLSAVLQTSSFNTDNMRQAAAAHFITATGLADALVETGLPFKQAHTVVSRTVDYALRHNLQSHQITAQMVRDVSSIPLEITDALVQQALDPEQFVMRRTTLGGSAPSTVQTALEQSQAQLQALQNWREHQRIALEQAAQSLAGDCQAALTSA